MIIEGHSKRKSLVHGWVYMTLEKKSHGSRQPTPKSPGRLPAPAGACCSGLASADWDVYDDDGLTKITEPHRFSLGSCVHV